MQVLGVYSVSKTALLSLCKVMVNTCAGRNVRIDAVAPGLIQTKFSEIVSMRLYICVWIVALSV